MPQLTIYLDARSAQLLTKVAKKDSARSLSSWAREKLLGVAATEGWPVDYPHLFGSIKDASFEAPPDAPENLEPGPYLS